MVATLKTITPMRLTTVSISRNLFRAQNTVTIVTVVHHRRDPKRWQSLIED
jgi:hypothetical protein